MTGAQRALLPGARWHFQHGPIDIVIQADGENPALQAAHQAAWCRFETVLAELVAELPTLRMPANSFGSVPTPAIVAPIEFSLRLADYQALGGHMADVRPLAQVLATGSWHPDGAPTTRRFVAADAGNPWPLGQVPMLG